MQLLKATSSYKIYRLSNDFLDTFIAVMLETRFERTLLTPTSDKPIVVHKNNKQLTIVADGTGEVVLNGENNLLQKANMVIFEANTTHAFIAKTHQFDLYHWHFNDNHQLEDRYILTNNMT
jgi:mannose-6-phosphate isomerase-like protein (cupin superfamily)